MNINKNIYFFKQTKETKNNFFIKNLFTGNISNSNKVNYKKYLKYLKIFIFTISAVLIFWSFIQSFAESFTQYSTKPGSGLEFGFFPGVTKDYRYDLSSLELNPHKYHPFWRPTYKYGPFLSLLVYPFSYLFNSLIYQIKIWSPWLENNGLHVIFSMLIIIFCMRIITFATSLRAAYYMDKQYQHKSYLDNINEKYSIFDASDQKNKRNKQQEIAHYNQKHGLKPFVPFENFFINTPIFLIVFKLITISRPVKFTSLFGIWELSKIPSSAIFYELFDGGWIYLTLCLFIIPFNFYSQRSSNYFLKKRHPQISFSSNKEPHYESSKNIQNIITVCFLLFTFFCSTGLSIYYFFNSIFTMIQALLIHRILLKIKKNKNTFDNKLKKLGI